MQPLLCVAEQEQLMGQPCEGLGVVPEPVPGMLEPPPIILFALLILLSINLAILILLYFIFKIFM